MTSEADYKHDDSVDYVSVKQKRYCNLNNDGNAGHGSLISGQKENICVPVL